MPIASNLIDTDRIKGAPAVNMGFGLYQEQSQRLVLTTQMKQALEVLQCSAWELYEYMAREADENPWLECVPPSTGTVMAWLRRSGPGDGASAWSGEQREALPLEQLARAETGLADMLAQQIGCMKARPEVLRVARVLLGMLDESGYLTEEDPAIARWLRVPVEWVTEAVSLIQSCEPLGVGARSLQECLRLQLPLVPEPLRDTVMHIINDHLDDVANGRIPKIAKQLGLSTAAVQAAVDALRRLHPRPGASYGGGRPVYIVPDVIVERVGADYVVRTNDAAEPRIRMNPAYRRWLERPTDDGTRSFLEKKLHALEWLLRCLEQRRLTLHRVAEAIVEVQRSFFDEGLPGMRPLTLRQVAERLGIHESTVSRATRGKYMQTPRGLFEMRFFFTSELSAADGAASAQAAKHYIRLAVESEDAARPLSDDAIAKQLADRGIRISRRTVAKYREEMRIPPSHQRRRFSPA